MRYYYSDNAARKRDLQFRQADEILTKTSQRLSTLIQEIGDLLEHGIPGYDRLEVKEDEKALERLSV